MGLPLSERRASQCADRLGEDFVAHRHETQARGDRGRCRQGLRADHHARVVQRPHAQPFESLAELRWCGERCDAQHHRQARVRVDLLAQHQFAVERKNAGGNGVHAARAFRLSGGKPNQPAINKALLWRRTGVEAGLFDAVKQLGRESLGHMSKVCANFVLKVP